ncbi:oligosaccharide flippase family protein [Paeniroseomonas aquatica]|uniref:Oligosaccharide flippase family protein n=2 Tax=Paeniroseomonas aquatica TaxID=373043 RepID=A0ABT8ABK0_9PROT|nr:oligosaccharide flippase family protein [Paeniroseomonas aquatica]MDN3566836.1 oligosaccharide flippase family protein [Paeniroseomonas aquatica]
MFLALSRLIGRLIDFLTLLVLARLLTPADFGIAALAMTLVATIDMVLEVPVTQALIRLKHIDKSHLDTGFTIGILRSCLLTTVILALAWPFAMLNGDPHLALIVAFMAAGPAVRGLVSPTMTHFLRDLRYSQTVIIEVSGKLFGMTAAILVVLNGGMYWAIVANYLVTSVAAVGISYIVSPYRPAISLARLSDFSGFVGWLSLSQTVAALNWQGDRFLVGVLAGKEWLGRYAIANDLAVLPTQSLIGPAMQPVMAAFARINAEPERLRLAFVKTMRFTMMISTPACIGIALTADLLIETLLGPNWQEAAPLLRLLVLSVMPVPYYQCLYSLGLALNRTKTIFRLNLIDLGLKGLLLPVGFFLAAVPGACVARILVSTSMVCCNALVVRRLLGLGIRQQLRSLWKIAVAITAMIVGVILLRYALRPAGLPALAELLTVSAAGAALYGATLALLGERFRLNAL